MPPCGEHPQARGTSQPASQPKAAESNSKMAYLPSATLASQPASASCPLLAPEEWLPGQLPSAWASTQQVQCHRTIIKVKERKGRLWGGRKSGENQKTGVCLKERSDEKLTNFFLCTDMFNVHTYVYVGMCTLVCVCGEPDLTLEAFLNYSAP